MKVELTLLAANRLALPAAVMVPLFSTMAPIRLTPPVAALMLPRLTMAPGVPEPVKVHIAGSDALSLTSRLDMTGGSDVASSPPTLIVLPPLNTMPLVLTRKTLPTEDNDPLMTEAAPEMMLIDPAAALGMSKVTELPWAISKPVQLISETLPFWLMIIVLPFWLMVALFCTGAKPVGRSAACTAGAMAAKTAVASSEGSRRPARVLRVAGRCGALANSAATWIWPRAALKTRR